MTNKNYRSLLMAALAALSLGLAPFSPEPHIVGKVKWLLGGASGMGFQDYFDLLLHGVPWLWFMYEIVMLVRSKVAK